MYLLQCWLLHPRPLGSDNMHGLADEVYSNSGSVSLAMDSYYAEVDGHSDSEVDGHFDSEVVGMAVVADSAAVVALVGSGLLIDFTEVLVWVAVEEAYCLGSCCLGNPSPCCQ